MLKSNRIRRLAAPIATAIRQSPALLHAARFLRHRVEQAPHWNAGADEVDSRYRVDFRQMLPQGCEIGIGLISTEECELPRVFQASLNALGLKGQVFNPKKSDFHDRILGSQERLLLCRPEHFTNQQRQMVWEKMQPLYDNSRFSVHPGALPLRLYEAKRELAYFLAYNRIPHPETHVFHELGEALNFAATCPLPQVFKTNTGSSATGVEIICTREDLASLVRDVFRRYYVKRSLSDYRDIDYGYVILQNFLHPVREFRVIKIGESWFGHEKLPGANSDIMSGSGVNAWTPPPLALLDFCASIAEKFDFETMCFDVFQSGDGPYLVNELQTWFGSYDNSQMYIDGTPGRYVFRDGAWNFESGFFNQYRSLALIIANAVSRAEKDGFFN